ncbi:hypothetical protein CB1_000976026 [Camelus ferus]|nr:hypothetical protein CB1_000976026 [Camelus ferus]
MWVPGLGLSLCVTALQLTSDSKTFWRVEEEMSWYEALDYCRRHHTDLADLQSTSGWSSLAALYALSSSTAAWVGLFFDGHVGGLRWSSGSTFSDPEWGSLPIFEDGLCATLYSITDVPSLGAASCTAPKPFICYYGLSGPAGSLHPWLAVGSPGFAAPSLPPKQRLNAFVIQLAPPGGGSTRAAAQSSDAPILAASGGGVGNASSQASPIRPMRQAVKAGVWVCLAPLEIRATEAEVRIGGLIFKRFDQERDWLSALRFCRTHYTDLADLQTVTDKMGKEALKSITTKVEAWIGLYIDKASGSLRWSSDLGPNSIPAWLQVPQFGAGLCAGLRSYWSFSPRVSAVICSSLKPFICFDGA